MFEENKSVITKNILIPMGGIIVGTLMLSRILLLAKLNRLQKVKKRSAEIEDSYLAKHEHFLLLAGYLFYRSAIKSSEELTVLGRNRSAVALF